MDFHVGSLADIIHQKTSVKTSGTKLFDSFSSGVGNEVQFKVIPIKKRKKISKPDLDCENNEADGVWNEDRSNFKKAKQSNADNAAMRVQRCKSEEKVRVINPEEDRRTIFVGNLPCNIKVTTLKKLFKPYGKIESARLRCPPIKDTKLPKRVAVIKREFHPDRTNIVGFVRFTSEKEATDAIKANGLVYNDHNLRVDLSTKSRVHDQKKAVFVGNVHFGTEENDMWKVFECCGPIESVRIVRDPITGVGKGFAYVNFKELSSVELALKLDGHELKERQIRVTRAVKKVKVRKGDPRFKKKSQGMRKRGAGQEWKREKKGLRRGQRAKEEDSGAERADMTKKRDKDKRPVKKNSEDGPSYLGNKTELLRKVEDLGQKWVEDRKPFKRGGGKMVESKGEFGERTGVKKLKKNLDKSKSPVKSHEEGPSFLGNKIDNKVKEKIKKKKLSKSDLKKKVLAFQLQLKQSGIKI